MRKHPDQPYAATIVRVAFWGQLVGFFAQVAFLAYEDAPDVFAGVSPLAILVPLVCIAALYLLHVDRFLARFLSPSALALSVLLISASTTILALLLVIQAYQIPEFLLTPGWEYTRLTSVLVLIAFSTALAVNVYMIVRGRGTRTSAITRDGGSARQGTRVPR